MFLTFECQFLLGWRRGVYIQRMHLMILKCPLTAVEFVQSLQSGTHALHCRKGEGSTTNIKMLAESLQNNAKMLQKY